MQYCNTQATLKCLSRFSWKQQKYGTQRSLCFQTFNPVFVGSPERFSSLNDRKVALVKNSSVTLASRLLLSNRVATGTRAQASAGTETLEPDSYYASLIRLPEELCAAIDDGSTISGLSRHFVLLAKTPTCDLQMCSNGSIQELSSNKTTASTVKLTPTQSDNLYRFMDCPLYVYLYSACIPALWRSMNQRSSALLPCWTSNNTDWSIAWDVVEAFSSHNAKAAFNRFIWNLAKFKTKSFPYKKFSLEPLDKSEEQQGEGLISSDELLTDSFLNVGALENESTDSAEDAENCRQYLSNSASEVLKQPHLETMFGTSDEEGREPFYQSYLMQFWHQRRLKNDNNGSLSSDWELQDYGMTPSLAPWLVLLLCMPNYVVNAIHYAMALKWKECFSIGDEISTSALSSTIGRWEDPDFDLTKMAACGSSLLRIMAMLSKFPSYEEVCKDIYGQVGRNTSARDTVDDHTTKRINQFNVIDDVVWSTMLLYKNHLFAHRWFTNIKEISSDSSGGTKPAKKNAKLSEQDSWDKRAFINNIFAAFIGHYYIQHGVGAVWKICKEIGVVKDDPDSGFCPDSEEWQEKDPIRIPYKEKWQEMTSNSESDNSNLKKIFKDFTNRLGYTFRSESFFELGIEIWTSRDFRDEKFLEWYSFLGRVFMNQFFQSFMMQKYPDLSQEEINRIISGEVKKHLYIKLAFVTDLPLRKSRTLSLPRFFNYQDPGTRTCYSLKDVDIDEIKSRKPVEKHVYESMLGMLGFVIFDSGCSIPKFNKIIEPLMAENIKDIVANNGQIPKTKSSNP